MAEIKLLDSSTIDKICPLYTSDAADEEVRRGLGGPPTT